VEVRWQIITVNISIPYDSINIFNIIIEILNINPCRRLTILQIMRHPMIRDRDSEAGLPPNSTQIFPGTPSPSMVRTMRVIGYKFDRNTFSCSSQEEFSGSLQAPKSVPLTDSSSGDTFQKKKTLMEERNLSQKEAIKQEEAIIQNVAIIQ
jgi:serine/threonine protein kinase